MSSLAKICQKGKVFNILGEGQTMPVACICTVEGKNPLATEEENNEAQKVDAQDETQAVTTIVKNSKLKSKTLKYFFCNPLIRPMYNELRLLKFPNQSKILYKKRGVTTQHIKFSNITLKPVYLKLYKIDPPLNQLTFINMKKSRCKRILSNLSFSLGFLYDDVEGKMPHNATLIAIASCQPTTTCYQICEIDLVVAPQS